MKKLFCFVASIAMSLSAVAPAATAADASSSARSVYCWKSKLSTSGDNLVCNWAETPTEACKGNPASDLSKASIAAEPTDTRRCENGQQLVRATKK